MSKKEIRLHNIYSDLCGHSPICKSVYAEICAAWNLDEQQFSELWLGAVPNEILNVIICGELQRDYGDISDVPGFYINELGGLALDVSAHYSRRGFMMPIRNERRLITSIKIYRSVKDTRPFTLKTRINDYVAA